LITENLRDGAVRYHQARTCRLDSLESLFRRPWFRRCWTFQEMCLGDDPIVLYGNLEIEFANFLMALSDGQCKFLRRLFRYHSRYNVDLVSTEASELQKQGSRVRGPLSL
jgi:hypothetical protein